MGGFLAKLGELGPTELLGENKAGYMPGVGFFCSDTKTTRESYKGDGQRSHGREMVISMGGRDVSGANKSSLGCRQACTRLFRSQEFWGVGGPLVFLDFVLGQF